MNRLPSDLDISSSADPAVATLPSPAAPRPQGMPDPTKRPTIVAKPLSRKIWAPTIKVIRRIHLYTGLLLLPWVLIFGFSGFVFNHGAMFRPTQPETILNIAQTDLEKDLGFAMVNPAIVASQVVEQLNAQAEDGVTFKLNGKPQLRGLLSFTANGDDVRHTYTMNLNTGKAWVATVPTTEDQPETTTPSFAGKQVQVAALPVDGLTEKIDDLTYELGIDSDGNWAMRGRGGGPEVRFVMQDDAGRDWNVSYNVLRGTLAGRATDEKPELGFGQTLTRLHRLHHYPSEFGMRWLWILASDITALTMVFWALSGLIMWWQLKPTRTIGIAGLSIAAVLGLAITIGTLDDMTFGGVAQRGRAPANVQRNIPTPAPAPGSIPGTIEAAPTGAPRGSTTTGDAPSR